MKNGAQTIITLVGPTAIGKTELALRIAENLSCEIVSVDSMQIYRYMDIGTAKPTKEEQARIPHHLIDIVDPDEDYTAARFAADARKAVDEIRNRGHIALLAGGTGLYLRALLEGLFDIQPLDPLLRKNLQQRLRQEGRDALFNELRRVDPVTADRLHPNDSQRLLRGLEIYHATHIPWSEHLSRQVRANVPYRVLKFGLTCDRQTLYKRIDQRVDRMIGQGLCDEVRTLLGKSFHGGLKSMQSIGYRHMVNYLEGRWTREEAVTMLARDTRRYAKRQFTWFQRDPEIDWIGPLQRDELIGRIKNRLAEEGDRP